MTMFGPGPRLLAKFEQWGPVVERHRWGWRDWLRYAFTRRRPAERFGFQPLVFHLAQRGVVTINLEAVFTGLLSIEVDGVVVTMQWGQPDGGYRIVDRAPWVIELDAGDHVVQLFRERNAQVVLTTTFPLALSVVEGDARELPDYEWFTR